MKIGLFLYHKQTPFTTKRFFLKLWYVMFSVQCRTYADTHTFISEYFKKSISNMLKAFQKHNTHVYTYNVYGYDRDTVTILWVDTSDKL